MEQEVKYLMKWQGHSRKQAEETVELAYKLAKSAEIKEE